MTVCNFRMRGFTSYVASLRPQIRGFFAALRMTVCNFGRDWSGEDVHGGGVGAYGGGVDPGAVVADAEVVDEVAGFEVVGAVEDDVGGEEAGGVVGDEVGDVGVD